ncbi:alpha/beta hydrolase-fold protein, partial [Bacillus sp. SIMBA_005]|uniref:alpha/beta hydrolase-fold protein n=1 Tax=Bacillus sp. SIMBA_005 TaxID=3085754 RepID=UPI00397C627C
PAVHDAYNVSSKVKQTGVAGIGEGAAQALELSLSEPGVYGSVGSFSGYLTESVTSKQAKKINAKTDLLRFYVGNVLDSNYNATFDAVQQLSDAGVRLE